MRSTKSESQWLTPPVCSRRDSTCRADTGAPAPVLPDGQAFASSAAAASAPIWACDLGLRAQQVLDLMPPLDVGLLKLEHFLPVLQALAPSEH